MKISLRDIYVQFFLLGLQLLGGGYVIVPLMKKYIIEEKHWITDEELSDFYALSQSIPGVIAINISAFTGYKLRGKSGSAVALTGIITSPVISVIIIAMILDKILQISFIQSIFWGVGISIIILIYLSVKEIWKNSVKNLMSWLIFSGTLILSFVFHFSPVLIIVSALVFGVIYQLCEKMRAE